MTGAFDQQGVQLRGATSAGESKPADVGRGAAGGNSKSNDTTPTISAEALRNAQFNRDRVGKRCDALDGCPGLSRTTAPAPTAAPAPGTPGLSDVARFLTGDPTVTSEPGGWTIAGANTNFITSAGERQRSGELLGKQVVVRFTPVAYVWRYGDGSGQTTTTPGAPWAASDLPAFSKTATSHAYADRGAFTVTVTVEFSARYQFAGQVWTDIPGTLGLTSDPITVTVKGVKTVLVGQTCDENPSGPGC